MDARSEDRPRAYGVDVSEWGEVLAEATLLANGVIHIETVCIPAGPPAPQSAPA